jgi:hypothetical protein
MEIDQVNHVKRFDYYSKDIKQILEKNIIYSETGGQSSRFFGKKQVKRDNEKQSMIRDSAIGRLKEEENGQHNSPMVRGIQP